MIVAQSPFATCRTSQAIRSRFDAQRTSKTHSVALLKAARLPLEQNGRLADEHLEACGFERDLAFLAVKPVRVLDGLASPSGLWRLAKQVGHFDLPSWQWKCSRQIVGDHDAVLRDLMHKQTQRHIKTRTRLVHRHLNSNQGVAKDVRGRQNRLSANCGPPPAMIDLLKQ